MGEWQHLTPEALDSLLVQAPRKGWLLHEIPRPLAETTRLHNARLKASVYQYQKRVNPVLDLYHMLSLVDAHDMTDIFDDITPHDGHSSQEKYIREQAQAMQVAAMMGPLGVQYLARWHAAHKRADAEAVVVWELDKAEPCIEAIAYAHRLQWNAGKTNKVLDEFFTYACDRVQCPTVLQSLRTLRVERPVNPRERYYSLFAEHGRR